MSSTTESGLRLQVFLARAGVASRRASEDLIRHGVVTVNGEVVTKLGTRIDPGRDRVKVRGKAVHGPEHHVYLMLNKPRGVVSTASDPEGRSTVLDLVQVKGARLFPVGRLDLQSEGLMLLTNDGELAQRLLHPRHEVPRTYLAKIRGQLDAKKRQRLARGIVLDGKKTQPLVVKPVRQLENASWVEVVVREGRQHLVRDALDAVGHPVVKLRRTAFGPLKLGKLPLGRSRPLTEAEMESLRGEEKRTASKSRRRPASGARAKSPQSRGSRRKR